VARWQRCLSFYAEKDWKRTLFAFAQTRDILLREACRETSCD